MKTSTFFAGAAAIGCFLTLTAANLKLKNEYTSGHMTSAVVFNRLPSFHYIKEAIDSNHFPGSYVISSDSKKPTGISAFYYERAKFMYHVVNDTLFIQHDPEDKDNYVYYNKVTINTSGLKGLTAQLGNYNIVHETTDSLHIIANRTTNISVNAKKIAAVKIEESEHASVKLFAEEPIDMLDLTLGGMSNFFAEFLTVKTKSLKISHNASLCLRGQALQSFGVNGLQQN